MKKESQVIFDKNVIEFVTVAAEFCAFLERAESMKRSTFVDTTLKILPLLYLKASMLPKCEMIGDESPETYVTEEIYEVLRINLASILAEKDDYLEVFLPDMAYSDEPIKKNISEDLADIYQDIKDFIFVFQLGLNETMNDSLAICQENFGLLWGQKLVNTMRALHDVKYSPKARGEDEEEEEYEEDAYNDGQDSSDYVDFRDYMPQKSERKAQKEVRRTSAQRQNVKHTPGRAQNSSHKASRSAQQVDFRLEKNKGRKHKKDAVAPESEKTIPYRPRKSRQKEIDLPLGSFDTEDSYHPMNDDYEEPVVIDEDELDEEVLREMMDEDDREGEELWKKISRRDDTHKKRK